MAEQYVTRTCIVCRKQLCTPEDQVQFEDSQRGGILCCSSGNYGSRVFDPGGGIQVEICVCDDCLEAAKDIVNTFVSVRVSPQYHFRQGLFHEYTEIVDTQP